MGIIPSIGEKSSDEAGEKIVSGQRNLMTTMILSCSKTRDCRQAALCWFMEANVSVIPLVLIHVEHEELHKHELQLHCEAC